MSLLSPSLLDAPYRLCTSLNTMKPAYPTKKDCVPIDDDLDSTCNTDLDSLFDSSDDEADSASDTDSESPLEEVSNNTEDDDDDLFDDEVRYPPEYYIAASANLDVSRLRQERYSPKTQARLDVVKEHHDRYVPHGD
jgi:hypothetical protein